MEEINLFIDYEIIAYMFNQRGDYALTLYDIQDLRRRVEEARTYDLESDQALIGKFRSLFYFQIGFNTP